MAGLFQMVVIRLHAEVEPLNAVEEQGDGRDGNVDHRIEAAEDVREVVPGWGSE